MNSNFIKQLRIKNRLTQEEVAKAINLSRPTYAKIETSMDSLTLEAAKKLADLFDISVDNLIHGIDSEIAIEIQKSTRHTKDEKNTLRISIPEQQLDKFKQILLYILKKIGGKPNIGKTVLFKIIYFIDFDYYEKYEEQIMGLVYKKSTFGPTPAIFDVVMRELIDNNFVEQIKSKFYQREQTKYLINPNVELNLSLVSGKEINHINWELERLSNKNVNELSNFSHKDVPWLSAKDQEIIDYEAVFYRTEETSVRTYDRDNN